MDGIEHDVAPTTSKEEPCRPSLKSYTRAAARLLTFMQADANTLALPQRWVAVIALTCFLASSVIDRLDAGSGAEFYSYGLLSWSWYACALLMTTWLCARLTTPAQTFLQVLTLLVTFLPVAIAGSWLTVLFVDADHWRIALLALVVYAAAYLATGLRSLCGSVQPRAVFATWLVWSAAVLLSLSIYATPRFWYDVGGDDEQSTTAAEEYLEQWRRAEAVLFEQSGRIDAAVAAMKRPAELQAGAFFLGFGGMGEERVFAGEIALAQKVIADKYGSGERSLQLVNDRRDLNAHPLASPTALRFALQAMARRMNVEQDVLFLALSSHGSDEGYISVSNSGMPLNDLRAADLAAALRDSGIKWKVVIVSACYAGTFIEPLRDDSTIVIAAAAADRTSFGCSDDRELTYFGEAFYRDTLPGASTLREAVEKTKVAITAREKQENKKASNPQAHFGAAAEAQVAKLSR